MIYKYVNNESTAKLSITTKNWFIQLLFMIMSEQNETYLKKDEQSNFYSDVQYLSDAKIIIFEGNTLIHFVLFCTILNFFLN